MRSNMPRSPACPACGPKKRSAYVASSVKSARRPSTSRRLEASANRSTRFTGPRLRATHFNSHGVERAPHEDHGHDEEHDRQAAAQEGAALGRERHGQLYGQETEERGELDDGFHGEL